MANFDPTPATPVEDVPNLRATALKDGTIALIFNPAEKVATSKGGTVYAVQNRKIDLGAGLMANVTIWKSRPAGSKGSSVNAALEARLAATEAALARQTELLEAIANQGDRKVAKR